MREVRITNRSGDPSRWVTLCVLFAVLFGANLRAVQGQESAQKNSVPQAAWNGLARVGYWTAVHLEGTGTESLKSRDGSGLDVVYPVSKESAWAYIKVGSTPIVEAHGTEDRIHRLELQLVDTDRTWIVGLGTDAKFKELRSDVVVGASRGEEITLVDDVAKVPDHRDGWDGIDMVIVSFAEHAMLSQLSERQVRGFLEWVYGGGRVFVIGGPESEIAIERVPWLMKMFPDGSQFAKNLQTQPGSLEDFAASRDQLAMVSAVGLPEGGRLILRGSSVDREPVRLIAEYLVGLGRVTAIAADINAAPIADWPGRNRLIRRLFSDVLEQTEVKERKSGSANASYNDLAGQLRSTLDRPSRSRPPFSWLIAIAIAYVLLLGPIDYWVINRWLGKPLLGWVTFPLVVVAAAAGLMRWHQSQQPSEPQIRQVDVVDLVPSEEMVRGFSWAQFEIAAAGEYDLKFVKQRMLGTATEGDVPTAWQGVAGAQYGGIDASAAMMSLPAYTLTRNVEEVVAQDGVKQGMVEGVPIAAAGSKGLSAEWQETFSQLTVNELRQVSTSGTLTGSLINPLQVDLLEPLLLFRNNVYQLPTRIPAGGEIGQLERLPQKNFSWRLTRRKLLEGSSESTTWDRGATDQLGRLMEILLFHGAAGGLRYTDLHNRPLHHLDLSYVLAHDRAILIGRMAEPATELRDAAGSTVGEELEHLSLCRIILPVIIPNSSQAIAP